jgi:hypothetical protein
MPRLFRPRLEPLEGRLAPTSFSPSSFAAQAQFSAQAQFAAQAASAFQSQQVSIGLSSGSLSQSQTQALQALFALELFLLEAQAFASASH